MIIASMIALSTIGIGAKADASEVKVAAGDTVSTLAKKHKVSVDKIVKWNKLNDKNFIVVGDKLNIDGKDVKSKKLKSNQKQAQTSQYHVQSVQQTPVPQTQPVQQPTRQNIPESVKEQPVRPQSSSAKDQVAYIESRGDYNAQNGQFIGKYQLTASYLNGDYSEANQERAADKYVADRYGNWDNALAHEHVYGWY